MHYQYKILITEIKSAEAQLNVLAAEGWELVSYSAGATTLVHIVLRRIPSHDNQFMAGV